MPRVAVKRTSKGNGRKTQKKFLFSFFYMALLLQIHDCLVQFSVCSSAFSGNFVAWRMVVACVGVLEGWGVSRGAPLGPEASFWRFEGGLHGI